jgi:hypothetical protein
MLEAVVPYTPIEPSNPAGSQPASSRACHAHCKNNRCCGSIIRAVCGGKPKNSASNSSTPLMRGARRTYDGLAKVFSLTPAALSWSSDNVTIDSLPHLRLSQNCDSESAPGSLPAMPTIAMALGGSNSDASLDSFTRLVLSSAASRHHGEQRRVGWHDREHR